MHPCIPEPESLDTHHSIYFGKSTMGKSARGWFFGFQVHTLIHWPTGVVLTSMLLPAMLLPLGWDDRRAVQSLSLSTGGGAGLGGQGYNGVGATAEKGPSTGSTEAQALRVMPSDEGRSGLSAISQVR